jgi:hypothetical protein
MKTIKPAEISGKIISLIDEADKELVVISPYNDLEHWDKLAARLKKAIGRGIKISFFVRKGAKRHEVLSEPGVQVYYVEKLHAKIFLSEKQAILTSMNLVEAADKFSIDFGIETENTQEFEEVKMTYLRFIQKNVCKLNSQQQGCIKNRVDETAYEGDFACAIPTTMKLFEAHFQKAFRRYNLVYNNESDTVSCSNFPFQWTNFEYSGAIKISLLLGSGFDYSRFRNENINEFNEVFRSHKTCWSYPYDTIRIYGDEAANGINVNDTNSLSTYRIYLIEEVTKFLQSKEFVLLKTPLYKLGRNKVYC